MKCDEGNDHMNGRGRRRHCKRILIGIFGDRLDLRDTRGREFKENSTLIVEYSENGKTHGNETKT